MPVFKKINRNFFKKWTPDMAYVLGFFAADGYITVNRRGGQFWCMDITDKKLLEEIKKSIKSDHKISTRIRKGIKRNAYRLQIGSIEMCNDLRVLGYSERKTKCLVVPKIPDKYFSHFMRGYFDGDGNVWHGYVHKERKTKTLVIHTVLTSCSYDFLEHIRLKLENFSIENGRLRREDRNYSRLVYSVRSSLKLYKYMYNMLGTSKLFLKRKKEIFEKYIESRNATVAQR